MKPATWKRVKVAIRCQECGTVRVEQDERIAKAERRVVKVAEWHRKHLDWIIRSGYGKLSDTEYALCDAVDALHRARKAKK